MSMAGEQAMQEAMALVRESGALAQAERVLHAALGGGREAETAVAGRREEILRRLAESFAAQYTPQQIAALRRHFASPTGQNDVATQGRLAPMIEAFAADLRRSVLGAAPGR